MNKIYIYVFVINHIYIFLVCIFVHHITVVVYRQCVCFFSCSFWLYAYIPLSLFISAYIIVLTDTPLFIDFIKRTMQMLFLLLARIIGFHWLYLSYGKIISFYIRKGIIDFVIRWEISAWMFTSTEQTEYRRNCIFVYYICIIVNVIPIM
jgi:hypothetical protein